MKNKMLTLLIQDKGIMKTCCPVEEFYIFCYISLPILYGQIRFVVVGIQRGVRFFQEFRHLL